MSLVIKKRVSLEFLGDDYKDSYVVVRSMSMSEYDSLKTKDKDKTVRQIATEHFLEGVIAQDEQDISLNADNLDELPPEVFTKMWDVLVGTPDPKSEGQLMNPSSTTDQPHEN